MSTKSSIPPPPPPARRVVTGHKPDGTAVFLDDAPVIGRSISEDSETKFGDFYLTEEFPPNNDVEFHDLAKDKNRPFELFSPNGSSFRSVDVPPRSTSAFHRTVSLDYGIIAKGSIVCKLDGDQRTTLNEGDVIVQRGTIHEWINETDDWVRMYFIMFPSKKVRIGNKELETEFRTAKSV